jgi:hypothetical protein
MQVPARPHEALPAGPRSGVQNPTPAVTPGSALGLGEFEDSAISGPRNTHQRLQVYLRIRKS